MTNLSNPGTLIGVSPHYHSRNRRRMRQDRAHSGGIRAWSTDSCYRADGNGDVTMLLNASQAAVATYRYDPFGNTTYASGSQASANTMRFSSKPIHATDTLYHYGYRWYPPSLQRWIGRGPIGGMGRIKLYRLAPIRPVRLVDLFGLRVVIAISNYRLWTHCQACLCTLRKTQRGRELFEKLEGNAVLIKPDKSKVGTSEGGGIILMAPITHHGVGPKHPFWEDGCPEELPGYGMPDTVDNQLKACAVVLGHELGHAAGYDDEDVSGGDKVRQNENPIRLELGLPPRKSCHCHPLPRIATADRSI